MVKNVHMSAWWWISGGNETTLSPVCTSYNIWKTGENLWHKPLYSLRVQLSVNLKSYVQKTERKRYVWLLSYNCFIRSYKANMHG